MLHANHPLNILALGLRTELDERQRAQLRDSMGTPSCSWETLLAMANLHRVPLLWYLRLRKHGLAGGMPADLQDYLDALLEQNRVRNRGLLAALERCLESCRAAGAEVLLLKGGAALADDLYGDPGARLMGDLDLLVRVGDRDAVDGALRQLGFEVAERDRDNPFFLEHHHLPPYIHPGWHACVELHTEITDFRRRRAFFPERLFARARTVQAAGSVRVLHPLDRLLHNACHAMLQDAGWLFSWCSLHEWAEWDLLVRHAGGEVDYAELLTTAGAGGFSLQLQVYALVGQMLLGSPVPTGWKTPRAQRHARRLLAGLAWRGSDAPQPAEVRRHYLLHVLPHTWHTHHLNRQDVPLLRRAGYFLKLAVRPANWSRLRQR